MLGTAFTTENFRAYYDDINLRMKKKRADMKSLDLCLVVGMLLTGFDSKKLNTPYVDKNIIHIRLPSSNLSTPSGDNQTVNL